MTYRGDARVCHGCGYGSCDDGAPAGINAAPRSTRTVVIPPQGPSALMGSRANELMPPLSGCVHLGSFSEGSGESGAAGCKMDATIHSRHWSHARWLWQQGGAGSGATPVPPSAVTECATGYTWPATTAPALSADALGDLWPEEGRLPASASAEQYRYCS